MPRLRIRISLDATLGGLVDSLSLFLTRPLTPNPQLIMKTQVQFLLTVLTLLGTLGVQAQTPTFTYQGRLSDTNGPVSGSANLTFRIFTAASGGAQLWQETTNGVPVANGLFAVELGTVSPLGGVVLDGGERWLEAAVNGITLINRQKISFSPYAIRSLEAATAALVTTDGVATSSLQNNSVTSTKILDGTITAADVNVASFSTTFWKLDGNVGTTVGTHFLGTTDNQALELRVNNQRAWRVSPTVSNDTVNVVAGSSLNFIEPTAIAATIAGGGTPDWAGGTRSNAVAAHFATVGGGADNHIAAGAPSGVIAGGFGNRISNGSRDSTVSGGSFNSVGSNTVFATIGGGSQHDIGAGLASAVIGGGFGNDIGGASTDATISGGAFNTVASNAWSSTIGGGNQNSAGAPEATVAGGALNSALAFSSTIGGGGGNYSAGIWSTISGGRDNTNEYSAAYSAIGGGRGNVVEADTPEAFIGGGGFNRIGTNSPGSVIGGGTNNIIGPSTLGAAIGGGARNQIGALNWYSFLGGGWNNEIQIEADLSVIGGGLQNIVHSNAEFTVIGGGWDNHIQENATLAAIGGGYFNTIEPGAQYGTIGGGRQNRLKTNALYAAVGGGFDNQIFANASYSMIPGGFANRAAGPASFAAGVQANAEHQGAFVWADSQGGNFYSTTSNQFNVRASGGVRFVTGGAGLTVDGQSVFAGTDGSGLTSLNASQLTSGTVPDLRLSANVALRNTANDFFVGPQTLYSGVAANRALEVRGALGQAADLQQWQNQAGAVLAAVSAAGVFSGNGSGLTGLNASQLASGTVPEARLPATVARLNDQQTFAATNFFSSRVGINTASTPHLLTVGAAEPPLNSGSQIGLYDAVQAFYNARQTASDVEASFGVDGLRGVLAVLTDHPLVFRAGNGAGGGNVEYMRIAPGGNVGIGRTPTANRLEVQGEASKAVAGSWLANSDARIKEDIQPITGALDTLDKVRLVSFRYTGDYRADHPGVADRRYLNVVAQEFREVFPEYVQSSGERLADGSDILQVDTYPLTIYSAAAIQELNQNLKQKETEIAQLKHELEMLKHTVEKLTNANH